MVYYTGEPQKDFRRPLKYMTCLSLFSVLPEDENFTKLSLFDYTRVMVRDWEQNSPESLQAMVLSTLRSKFLVTLPHWKRKIKERGKFQEAKLGSTTVPLTFFRPDAHSVRIRKRVVLVLEH